MVARQLKSPRHLFGIAHWRAIRLGHLVLIKSSARHGTSLPKEPGQRVFPCIRSEGLVFYIYQLKRRRLFRTASSAAAAVKKRWRFIWNFLGLSLVRIHFWYAFFLSGEKGTKRQSPREPVMKWNVKFSSIS